MILIFEQDLTHYRASFYTYLAQLIKDDILILYGKGEPNSNHIFIENDSERNYKTIEIRRKWIGKSLYFQSLKDIKNVIEENNITCVIHQRCFYEECKN